MKDETRLEILEETARRLSIKLSYEDLHKGEVDTHGGMFKLRGEKRIIIHKKLSTEEKVDVLTDILSNLDTEGIHLPPDLRERLEEVKKRKTPPHKEKQDGQHLPR